MSTGLGFIDLTFFLDCYYKIVCPTCDVNVRKPDRCVRKRKFEVPSTKMNCQRKIVPGGFESDEEYDEFGDFIEKKIYSINAQPEDLQLTFQNACVANNVEEIIRVLKSGSVNINSYLKSAWTPIMYAAFNGSKDVLKYLLENGADPLLQYDCHNAIMCVCNCFDISKEIDLVDCLNRLLEYSDFDINSQDRIGMSALMYACSHGYLKIIKILINKGADIEMHDHQNGETALFFAVRYNHINVVKFLLSCNANRNATDKKDQTAHRIAENKNMVDILKLLSDEYSNEPLERVSEEHLYWNDVMNELENGFRNDVQLFLDALSMEIYTDHINSNKIIFKQLLTGNRKEFFKMGITLSPHHKLLDTALKLFHTWNWSNRTVYISKNNINAEIIAQILATVVRQLHVLDASIKYLGTQSHGLDSQKGQVAMRYLMNIKATENKIFEILDKQVRTSSVDYIKPCNLRKQNQNISIKETIFATSVIIMTLLRII